MPALLVHCSCPDHASAVAIAHALVEQRLAACVNLLPGMHSVYRWDGRIETATETLLLIKTTAARLDALTTLIVARHPNELPEIIAVEVGGGLDRYLDWIARETVADNG